MKKKLKKFSVPHTYTLIFILVLITGVSTWLIPSGVYDREVVDGRMDHRRHHRRSQAE